MKFRIEYSDHARERMKARRITRPQILKCLLEGELSGFDLRGRRIVRRKFGSRILIVVYVDVEKKSRLIVTTYWEGVLP